MKRKIVAVALFCLVLFGAILAGYWDMLDAERLRLVRDKAGDAIGEIAAVVQPELRPLATPPAASEQGSVPTPPEQGSVIAVPEEGRAPMGERGSVPAFEANLPPAGASMAAEGGAGQPAERVPGEAVEAEAPAALSPPPPAATAGSEEQAPPTFPAPPASTMPAGEKPVAAVNPGPSSPSPDQPEPPTFDILRVEPDGSAVLAGQGPAGATVRLQDGDKILGSDAVNANGEFVVVLDDPLPVGEHQLQIETTTGDGKTVTSAETAIISIPEPGREGELLALLEAPDRPSRLISLPAVEPRVTPTTEEAPAGLAPSAAVALPEVAGTTGSPAEQSVALPIKPAPAADAAEAKRNMDVASAGPPRLQEGPAPQQTPSPAPRAEPATAAEPAAPSADLALAVEAVEIEGETIYVAGRAPSGSLVRIYIDDRFLAEDESPDGDRFLVSAAAALPTGEHIVRADRIGPAGTVLGRVEVPFFKPEGRNMAAIARENERTATAGTAPGNASRTKTPADAEPTMADGATSTPSSEGSATAANAAPGSAAESDGAARTAATTPDRRVPAEAKAIAAGGELRASLDGPLAAGDAGRSSTTRAPQDAVAGGNAAPATAAAAAPRASGSTAEAPAHVNGSDANATSEGVADGRPAVPPDATGRLAQPDRLRPPTEPIAPIGREPSVAPETAFPDTPAAPAPRVAHSAPEPVEATPSGSLRPSITEAPGSTTDAGRSMPPSSSADKIPAITDRPSGSSEAAGGPGTTTGPDAVASTRPLDAAGTIVPDAAGGTTADAGGSGAGDTMVPVIRQPALEAANSRVIIRRGDTLWRISRESYGRGSRYTVIYLANGDQIRNPHRIYPGQVFRLPEEKAGQTPRAIN